MSQRSKFAVRRTLAIASSCIAVLAVPAVLFAHAVVFPKASTPGAFERYVLRVPNERAVATTRVELHFPADLRVTGFEDVPGWTLEVLTDSAKHIAGAVWTGTLEPQRFMEFPFMAANPKTDTSLAWPAYQTYANGERVEWTGAEGSKTPASVTKIAAATAHQVPFWLPWTSFAIAIIALGLAMRRPAQPAM